ncbi:MAG TPA: MBL fold metallo-hydrolase [Mycobacteriales bacterium]
MLVTGFPAGPPGTNCWVLAAGAGEQCLVVDPGIGAAARLDEIVAEHRLHPVAVLLTHGHIDHTFSVVPVCDARDVPAYIHPDDRGQLTDPWSAIGLAPGTPMYGTRLPAAEPADVRPLADGAEIDLAGLRVGVAHAPGHTPGSVAFSLTAPEAPLFFSGDLLFQGAIGRCDLPGGSEPDMFDSLARVVLPLADDTVVHPGHGPSTTVGRERRTNQYLEYVSWRQSKKEPNL